MFDLIEAVVVALKNSSLSDYRIAAETGISAPSIANYRKDKKKPSKGNLTVLANYFGIYPNSFGELEVFRPHSAEEVPATYVSLLPISAQAGSLDDFTQSVSAHECEQIISPIRSVDFAVPVTGDSMQPEYPSGSKILVKRINANSFIEWGRCYVLDTLNGIVIKKIMPATDSDKIKCVSINPDYPPFEVDKSDIRAMYRVLMLLSEK